MSILSRSIAVLTVAAGIAAAVPAPAAAAGVGVVTADYEKVHRRGDGRDYDGRYRDGRDHDGPRGWSDHRRHQDWRRAPAPWVWPPYRHGHYRPPVRHCRVEWNWWYRAYVRVCR